MSRKSVQKKITYRYVSFVNHGRPALFLLVLLLCGCISVLAQTKTITGTIKDASGSPIAGVSVLVKNTSVNSRSDENGRFSIAASKGATLVISNVGYLDKEISVNDDNTYEIQLVASTKDMDEIIVVGYGTQRKEAVTGSVASISGDIMREIPAANISQALQGRLAGVDISQTSTRPGATMQIRIRGERSLSGDNNPLVVLDGIPFPGSLADINPNDIKSIDILKDASATAIYGSRGANGVILVTTDKGSKGGKPRISYNAFQALQTVFAKYPMMNGEQYVKMRDIAGIYQTPGLDESDDTNTDWQDLFYRDGYVADHNISLTGGSAGSSYNFGVGYHENQGVVPTQKYKRINLRASLDQQVGKYFRFGLTNNSNHNRSEGNQISPGGPVGWSPIMNPYNADGSLKRTVRGTLDESFVLTRGVVEDLTKRGLWINENRNFATYNSLYGEVKIPWVDGLKYRVNGGLNYIQTNHGNFTAEGVNSVNAGTLSSAGISTGQTYHWTIENVLTYDKTFNQKHNVNVTALYSSEKSTYNSSSMSARDIPSEAFQFYNIGQAAGEITVNPNNQAYAVWGLQSYMGRVMYAYDNRYMISATLRSDGSSRLAPGHKWHTYPAISVGWNISKENFMERISWIDNLKVRAGWGQTSNQAVGVYSTLGLLSTRPYNFGDDTYDVGYYVTQLPNPGLGWEFSKTLNLGVDFELFNRRLTGTAEYYVTNTHDILLGRGLPPTSGVNGFTDNIGQTQNKGFELSLNGVILDNKNGWTWEAGINFYANRNRLVALASDHQQDLGNSWFVGYNINAIFDVKKIGLWQEKDAALMNQLEAGAVPGMIRVEYLGGYNPDGSPVRQIGADDRQVMNVDPNFSGGFNTRVSYKGFDLSLVGIYKNGGLLISNFHGPAGYLNKLTGRGNNLDVDYWTPDNPDAKYPNPAGPLSGDNPRHASTLAYFDASFLKVRTITLGYDFNRNIIKNNDVRLRMYFTVQNPFVMFSPFHRESGLDPETNSYGNENVATGGYPRRFLTVGTNSPALRNYVLGLNLNF